jgi:hypothetical protein
MMGSRRRSYDFDGVRLGGRKSRVCENCGTSKQVVTILYGLLTQEAMKDVHSGKYVMGGCCVDEWMPTLYCKKCDDFW